MIGAAVVAVVGLVMDQLVVETFGIDQIDQCEQAHVVAAVVVVVVVDHSDHSDLDNLVHLVGLDEKRQQSLGLMMVGY